MHLKVFDAIGAVAVLAWVGLMGAYAYEINFERRAEERSLDGGVAIRAGDSWLLLTREDLEVGYVHETRTPIDSGWLLEYEFMMNVASLGSAQLIRTSVKASVDHTAVLSKAQIEVETANTFSFTAEARTEGNELILDYTLGGAKRTRRIRVQEPPRLAQSAFIQLAARQDLQPGAVFEQEYFDPISMGMTSMRFEYVRRHEIDVYDKKVNAFHFVQKVINDEFDVYLDERGEVQIQELPLRIIGARVPNELGQARARSMERDFRSGKRSLDGAFSVDDAIGLIRGGGGLRDSNTFEVSVPKDWVITGDSGAQRVVARTEGRVSINTALAPDSIDEAEPAESLSEPVELEDSLGALVEKLRPNIEGASVVILAEKAARNIREDEESKELDSLSRAKLLLELIRREGVPARLVLGVEFGEEDVFRPHYWVQFYHLEKYMDLDPSKLTLLPSTRQIQLAVEPQVSVEIFEESVKEMSIRRSDGDSEEQGTAADFN